MGKDIAGFFITALGIIAGVAILYQLLTHPDAAVSEFKAFGGFVTSESKVLQGR